MNSWLAQIQRSRQGDCCRRGRRLREISNERLQVTFLLFIRYNSRYFYNKSYCFHSFFPYVAVFHWFLHCIMLHSLPSGDSMLLLLCLDLCLPVRNASELALLIHRALESVKSNIAGYWLALAHSLSLLCFAFSIHTGCSEHLHRKDDLGIRIIPVLCTRTE